jgi:hypothetical protein
LDRSDRFLDPKQFGGALVGSSELFGSVSDAKALGSPLARFVSTCRSPRYVGSALITLMNVSWTTSSAKCRSPTMRYPRVYVASANSLKSRAIGLSTKSLVSAIVMVRDCIDPMASGTRSLSWLCEERTCQSRSCSARSREMHQRGALPPTAI